MPSSLDWIFKLLTLSERLLNGIPCFCENNAKLVKLKYVQFGGRREMRSMESVVESVKSGDGMKGMILNNGKVNHI